MDKKQLHHLWRKLRVIRPWYFLILALISGIICVVALRDNNAHMARLRDAVYTADKNNSDVKGALQALQAYVTTHMNTSLTQPNGVYPPIQLKYTYDRLVQAESNQAAQANSQNAQIYTDAQHYCESQIPTGFSGRYRISCIEDYVTSHGISNPDLAPIPENLYQFDFVSPRWSPDLAGWTMVATAVLLVLAVVVFVIDTIIKRSVQA